MLPSTRRLGAAAALVWLVADLAGCGGLEAQRDAGPGDAGDLAPDGSADGSVIVDATFDVTTSPGDDAAPMDSASYGPEGNGPVWSDARICVPASCTTLGYDCGSAADGCGGLLQCGSCAAPEVCGASGFGQCGVCGGGCAPETCQEQGIACGPAGDGCGGLLQCGSCSGGQTCGGGGVWGQCGPKDGGPCPPLTCQELNVQCGLVNDGCGGLLMCGTCPSPQTCGGAGVPGQCAVPEAGPPPCCVPASCADQHIDCGPAGDGCGGILQCGSMLCPAPQTCGGGGFARCG